MRRAALAVLLGLAACEKPLPPGIERFGGDQAFFYSPQAKRLAFVAGRFPSRTRLVVLDPATGERTERRLKGWVLGGKLSLSANGGRALVEAGKIERDSRAEPGNRRVLLVDAPSGTLLSHTPTSAATALLCHPAWAPEGLAVLADAKQSAWWAPEQADRDLRRGLLPGVASAGVCLPDGWIALAALEHRANRVVAHAWPFGRRTASWPSPLSAAPLAAGADGRALVVRWRPESGLYRLDKLDPRTGREEAVLETQGVIETAVETKSALYAVAKDPSRPNASGKDWLAPRLLHVVERGGRRWSVPWTERAGRFLGAQDDGRLWFAVTDRNKPGAWRLSPDPETLKTAAAALD